VATLSGQTLRGGGDLARGINWVLEDTERYNQLWIRARQKVEQEFTLEIQASKYLKLYCKVL